MKHSKQLITVLISLFIALSPLAECSFTYAESGGGGASGTAWTNVSDKESMVAAFKAYCQSRNYRQTFNTGNTPAVVQNIVNYDYDQMVKTCALLNIDLDALNAELWYKVDQNGLLKFFFTSLGISKFNQLYSGLLTEHDIGENEDKLLYSGKIFKDLNDNMCYVYMLTTGDANITSGNSSSNLSTFFTYKGTPYKTGEFLNTQVGNAEGDNIVLNYQFNNSYSLYTPLWRRNNSKGNFIYFNSSAFAVNSYNVNKIVYGTLGSDEVRGDLIIAYYNGNYYASQINKRSNVYYYNKIMDIGSAYQPTNVDITGHQGLENSLPENKSMEVSTDSDTINNYITNNNSNDTYNYYDDDDPPEVVYTNPYDNNPTGGTIGGDGSINFQMPDLNIDWNLDFGNNPPFPFSIPFDIINFMQAFNTEPVTPHIEETITIANMDIDIDIDLEWLDDVAAYFRTFILLSYIIGLIIATRALFHIY